MNSNTQPQPTIVVTGVAIEERQGKNGPYFKQPAMFVRGDGASYPIELFVGDKTRPTPPGTYALSLRSYKPTKYGVEFDPTPGALISPAKAAA